MDETVQAAAKGLRKLRKRFDELLKESNGKRPTTYKKMRQFADALMRMVDEETRNAGLIPAAPAIIKTEIDVPSLDEHSPGAESKGEVSEVTHQRTKKEKLTKAQRERIERKKGKQPVYVPKGSRPAQTETPELAPMEDSAKSDSKLLNKVKGDRDMSGQPVFQERKRERPETTSVTQGKTSGRIAPLSSDKKKRAEAKSENIVEEKKRDKSQQPKYVPDAEDRVIARRISKAATQDSVQTSDEQKEANEKAELEAKAEAAEIERMATESMKKNSEGEERGVTL